MAETILEKKGILPEVKPVPGAPGNRTVTCPSCSAEIEFDSGALTAKCPYCDAVATGAEGSEMLAELEEHERRRLNLEQIRTDSMRRRNAMMGTARWQDSQTGRTGKPVALWVALGAEATVLACALAFCAGLAGKL